MAKFAYIKNQWKLFQATFDFTGEQKINAPTVKFKLS